MENRKNKKNRSHHHDPYVGMTNEQRYELLEGAKDALFKIVGRNKTRWGYDNWLTLLSHMACEEYNALHNVISRLRDSNSKRTALALTEEILRLSKSLAIYDKRKEED